jgi:hypothetical protein
MMSVVKVASPDTSRTHGHLVPGSRVEYLGSSWKVVGMYYAPEPQRRGDNRAAPAARERIRYMILQSLGLEQELLHHLGRRRSS